MDHFTKMAYYIPMNLTISVAKLAKVFINTIFKDYGTPMGITLD